MLASGRFEWCSMERSWLRPHFVSARLVGAVFAGTELAEASHLVSVGSV